MKNFFVKFEHFFITHQYRWYTQLTIFFIAILLTFLRRIDLFLYPQFWAEDGTVWYEDAYNLGGINPFFIPVAGYLQTISRIIGLLTQLFPLTYGPLVFNIIAVFIKVLPLLFLFSKRFSKIVPSIWSKILLSVLYISLPNTQEVFANVTNAQWFLVLLAFMILVADHPATKSWKVFDTFFLVLSGLSGPFVLFLVPIIILRWKAIGKQKYFAYLAALVVGCALIQGLVIFTHAFKARSHEPLGATPVMLIKVTAGQVYLSSLVGKEGYAYLYNQLLYQDRVLSKFIFLAIFIAGSSVIGFALLKGSSELRLFIVFCSLLFFSALIKPMGANWYTLMLPGMATRYWLFPMLGFVVSLVWLLSRQHSLSIRIFGVLILLVSIVGVKNEWIYRPWPDLKFKKYAEEFERVPAGTIFEIPIMPRDWHAMKLIKH